MDIQHFTGILLAARTKGELRYYKWRDDAGNTIRTHGIELLNEKQNGRYSVIAKDGLHGTEHLYATYHPAPIPRPQQRRGNRPTWHQYCRRTPRWGNDEWEAA